MLSPGAVQIRFDLPEHNAGHDPVPVSFLPSPAKCQNRREEGHLEEEKMLRLKLRLSLCHLEEEKMSERERDQEKKVFSFLWIFGTILILPPR